MLLELDGTLIIITISFLVFLFIMQKALYQPIFNVKRERQEYIANNEKLAQRIKQDSQTLSKDYEDKIKKAKLEARSNTEKLVQGAKAKKSKEIEIALDFANLKIDREKERILKEKTEAREKINSDIIYLAQEISFKVLGKEASLSGISPEILHKVLRK